MRSFIQLCMVLCFCAFPALWGCGSNKEPPTYYQPTTYTISGTIYWAANNRADSDVNDTESTVSTLSNDSFDEAQAIPSPAVVGGYVNISGGGVEGRSFEDGDEHDFYTATFQAGDIVRLVLPDSEDSDPAQVRLRLYDSGRNVLATMILTNGENDLISIDADGEYFVEVQALSGGTNYRLITGAGIQSSTYGSPSEFVPGEVLVKFKSRTQASVSQTREALAEAAGLRTSGTAGRWARMHTGDMATTFKDLDIQVAPQATGNLTGDDLLRARRRDTLRLVKALGARTEVEVAQPNYIRRASAFEPDDPLYGYQWHYDLIHLPDAWGLTEVWGTGEAPGSEDVIVAVIDSGILSDHPDLAGKIVNGYDFVSDQDNDGDGETGIDDDPEDPGINTGYHGTHVAGTIAAAFDNGIGVAGVGGDTRVMPIRVLGQDGGTDADIVNGIRWAAGLTVTDANGDPVPGPAQRADIINMSLGGADTSDILYDAIKDARAAGVILIAAAGNDANDIESYPASYSEVVSVGAVDAEAQLAPYSNFGSTIALAAPGGDMYADAQPDGYGDGILSTLGDASGNATYGFAQGTSMAAPHVSGVAALMKAVNPSLTPDDFDALIISGQITTDLGAAGRDDLYGYGLVDALKGVAAAGGAPATPMISVSPTRLHLDAFSDSIQLVLGYIGSSSPSLYTVSAGADSENWLTVLPNSGTNDFGPYTVTVNRSALGGGIYSGAVTIDSSTNDIDVPVTMDVLPDTTATAPTLYLLLLRATSLATVARHTLTPADGAYQFSFTNLYQGNYYLVCGSNLDNDDYISDQGEAVGYYPLLDDEAIDLRSNQTGLRFIAGFSQNTFTMSSSTTWTTAAPMEE